MKKLFSLFLLISLNSFASDAKFHDNSSCGASNVCVGQKVIGYFNDKLLIGYAEDIDRDNNVKIDIQAASPTRYWVKDAAPEVLESSNGLRKGMSALNKEGKKYRIRHIFSNDLIDTDNGNPYSRAIFQSHQLFKQCKCLGSLCSGDVVKTHRGHEFYVKEIFSNGMTIAELVRGAPVTLYTSTIKAAIKDLGFEILCSNEKPCECSN